jgi:hypothetical protein
MIQSHVFAHNFSSGELLELQTIIGHTIEAAFTHFQDDAHTFSRKEESKIEVCFNANLLLRFSNGYYIFSNHVLYNKFREAVCKVIFHQSTYNMPPKKEVYTEVWQSPMMIDKITIYSAIDQELSVHTNDSFSLHLWHKGKDALKLYSVVSDELIIFESVEGGKIAISAWDFFEGAIRLHTDTTIIETSVIPQLLSDRVTPRYYKRIEITKGEIEYLWLP